MKKTISVNISGIIFNIEEDAYDRLRKYLSTIKGYFSNNESRDEILDDIELRIAELFEERINTSKQVVTEKDVLEVIEIMGEPEVYIDEEEETASQSSGSNSQSYNATGKKLFRDKENGIVSGVCAGLGAYFQVDSVWIRLILVISVFFFGIGILPYIIMAIIIPEAKTTSDKIRMHGDSVDIDSIKKKVNEGIEKVKFEAENIGKRTGGVKNGVSKVIDFISDFLRLGFKFVGYLIGGLFIFLGLGLLLGLIGLVFNLPFAKINTSMSPISLDELMMGIFDSSLHSGMFILGICLLIGIPLLSIFLVGLKMLFRFEWPYRGVGASLVTAWIVGVFVTIFASINLGREYKYEDDISSDINIHMNSDTLNLKLSSTPMAGDNWKVNDWKINSLNINDGNVRMGNVSLDIVLGEDGESASLRVLKSARGSDYGDVEDRINNIELDYDISDGVLSIDPTYSFPLDDKLRGQQVKFELSVPEGKCIYLEDKIYLIIDKIEGVSRRSRKYLKNHYWVMDKDGLMDAKDWLNRQELEEIGESTDSLHNEM